MKHRQRVNRMHSPSMAGNPNTSLTISTTTIFMKNLKAKRTIRVVIKSRIGLEIIKMFVLPMIICRIIYRARMPSIRRC